MPQADTRTPAPPPHTVTGKYLDPLNDLDPQPWCDRCNWWVDPADPGPHDLESWHGYRNAGTAR